MTRLSAILLSALIAAAPLSAAQAQAQAQSQSPSQDGRARGDRDRGSPQPERRPRMLSPAEARAIAEAREPGARYLSYEDLGSGNYRLRFQRDGRVFFVDVRS